MTRVSLLSGPLSRLLASTGLRRQLVNCRRLVHRFAANLRGPAQPLIFAGAPLRAVIPVSDTTGNVPVTASPGGAVAEVGDAETALSHRDALVEFVAVRSCMGYPLYRTSLTMWGLTPASCGREGGRG